MINATITMGEDHSLNLYATNMNELVDKIKEWQDLDDHIGTLKQLKRPDLIERDTNSGWFYKKVT